MKPDNVHFAKTSDAPEVFQLMLDLYEDNGVFALNRMKAAEMCSSYFDPKTGIVGIIRGPKEIEGAIALKRVRPEYSDDEYLADGFNFVRVPYRKSSHASHLLDFGIYCADELGLPLVVGINSMKRVEAKIRFYKRKLLPFGMAFIHGKIPRLQDDMEQYARQDLEEDRETTSLLAEYQKAVEMFFDSKKPGRRAKDHSGRLTVDSAIERLKAVHAKAKGGVNGHAVAIVASAKEEEGAVMN